MAIPIQNLYYMLCYAWHILDEEEFTDLNAIPGAESSLSLLIYLLQKQNHHLIKKGIAQNYVRETQVVNGIKGKLEINLSFQGNLLKQGKAVCSFETTSTDILLNQVIKATLLRLLALTEITPEWKSLIHYQIKAFPEVKVVAVKSTDFDQAKQIKAINPYYKPVLAICELIWSNLLPEAEDGKFYFRSFLEDERQMGHLFEAFVRNFYRQEQKQYEVKAERIKWILDTSDETALEYLPLMVTDISLLSSKRNIIIDTKFYRAALLKRYEKQKLISAHLYQLFAYLKNRNSKYKDQLTEGMLLYPVVQQEIDLTYHMQGHQLSIKTINLAQPWPHIKQDLLAIIRA
ncbi:5-methylcytosine restriction system specificity protein McrC [Adhaeribacter aquaticus]|uniref:5-methylcytosine restriction system specificity protein McrC n=1 Tax=Adhaeribacter aquaticus TaxID=299567 RepID=UPI0012F811B3|nr:hypothetical protein [Adhaeribacter aquaticus]